MDIKEVNLSNLYPVILSGGSGSRLWPLSRQKSPKQFIPLIDDKNLLQNTCLRFSERSMFHSPVIVCNEVHRFQVAESLRGIGVENAKIILEPCAKNTAPAIALAALTILESDSDGIMLILPSDHYIKDNSELMNIFKGLNVSDHELYTFGVKPKAPEVGYGYIEIGEKKNNFSYHIKRFIEKPELEAAQKYITDDGFYWNSGIFLFKAKAYLDALRKYKPKIHEICSREFDKKQQDLDFIRIPEEGFSQCEDVSIDYAVMEKAKNVQVIPLLKTSWSDVGSWKALFELGEKDQNGNIAKGDVYQVGSKNCYFRTHSRMLSAVGVENLVVVETADAILVADATQAQDIKLIVDELKKDNRQEYIRHKRYYGPWGYSDQLVRGEKFIVNKLYFKVGAKSSLQMHHHRSEYFTVLSGAAKVVIEGEEHLLSEGMSINITPLKKHQVLAIGILPLEMLEIQSGNYISEDDIERF
ncbi:mannose-1-phosphate guanylyltransferase/mannose-6-phosphate isomerase [Cysteiniphilum halobium]|uniref:mannose-1-phosphate guanylyltransferase/mannose-6-phosphate isomerase n=1 Tax=Cysteiniphilum halobium TaxID=2219059 RepID=UPI000E6472C3|nr:mannose-1-phosphate guanylyltransferase/mannose-6-phosphate isomerase [Cysteiniphilum halobium]